MQTLNTIAPVAYDTNKIFDSSPFSMGTLGNPVALNLNPPNTSLFPGSGFSDIEAAHLFYDLTDYPIRTAVNLIYYTADTIDGPGCSGILVGPNMVLTATHCVRIAGAWVKDSILVAPAYNNGQFQPNLASSIVKKYFFFTNNYNGSFDQELCLLELREPIGLDIGWIGMADSTDTSYYSGKVFHKLIYPAMANSMDPTKIYNGDTLYYNYGLIDYLPLYNNHLGVYNGLGVRGQSGSSLFYTDNITEYYTFGVLFLATNYLHSDISEEKFYQLSNVIENYGYLVPIVKIGGSNITAKVYPNSFRQSCLIEFKNLNFKNYTLSLLDIQGRIVKKTSNIIDNKVVITRNNLNAGLYYFYLEAEDALPIVGKLRIQD
jgi:hypothetical protein